MVRFRIKAQDIQPLEGIYEEALIKKTGNSIHVTGPGGLYSWISDLFHKVKCIFYIIVKPILYYALGLRFGKVCEQKWEKTRQKNVTGLLF